MVPRVLPAVCSVAALVCSASFCLSAAAQTTPAAQQTSPPAAQSQSSPTPPLQLENLPPDSHTLTPAEQEEERREQAVQMALRLASIQAHWGPPMSSAGLSIALVETNRSKNADGSTDITYHLTGTGFTPGDHLTLVRWPLNTESQAVMSGLTLNPNGVAICPPPPPANAPSAPTPQGAPPAPKAPACSTTMQPNQPLEIHATAAAGEPIRVALLDNDRNRGAAVTIVPFPIANQSESCRLQVILGIKDATMVLVEGSGFPPNTPLKVESITGGETRTLHPNTSAQGGFILADLPAVKSETSGETTVRFAGVTHMPSLEDSKTPPAADPTCTPSVTFHWGTGAYKLQ